MSILGVVVDKNNFMELDYKSLPFFLYIQKLNDLNNERYMNVSKLINEYNRKPEEKKKIHQKQYLEMIDIYEKIFIDEVNETRARFKDITL